MLIRYIDKVFHLSRGVEGGREDGEFTFMDKPTINGACIHLPSASNVLPMASTCFNVLSLPEYPSKEVLKEKLILAITFGAEAFLYH